MPSSKDDLIQNYVLVEMLTLCENEKDERMKENCVNGINKFVNYYETNPIFGEATTKFDDFVLNVKDTGEFDQNLFFDVILVELIEKLCRNVEEEYNCNVEDTLAEYETFVKNDESFRKAITDILLVVSDNLFRFKFPGGGFLGNTLTSNQVPEAVNQISQEYLKAETNNIFSHHTNEQNPQISHINTASKSEIKKQIIKAVSSIAISSTDLWTSVAFGLQPSGFRRGLFLLQEGNDGNFIHNDNCTRISMSTVLNATVNAAFSIGSFIAIGILNIIYADFIGGLVSAIFFGILAIFGLAGGGKFESKRYSQFCCCICHFKTHPH